MSCARVSTLWACVALLAGCRSGSRAEAAPERQAGPRPEVVELLAGPVLWYGDRPACPAGLDRLLRPADLRRHCRVGGPGPVRSAGPSWCMWEYPRGYVALFQAPSFTALRRAFVEAPPVAAEGQWGFVWRTRPHESGGRMESFVLQAPGGRAVVVQASTSLCSHEALVAIGRLVARRIADERGP